MAVLRKKGTPSAHTLLPGSARRYAKTHLLIHLLSDGLAAPEQKGKEQIPSAAQALSVEGATTDKYPRVELSLEQARKYLHRESFALPSGTPKGFVIVTYAGYALGFMKNLGDRANNLYPKNWAIRSLTDTSLFP